jgi:hypothetical protein
MPKMCAADSRRNLPHPALAEVVAVRVRRTAIPVPTANDHLPPYDDVEIAAILSGLGVDGATSAARMNQLDELLPRARRSDRAIILSLILREIELWEPAGQ